MTIKMTNFFTDYLNMLFSIKIPAFLTFVGVWTGSVLAFESPDIIVKIIIPIISLLVPLIIGARWTWWKSKRKAKQDLEQDQERHRNMIKQERDKHIAKVIEELQRTNPPIIDPELTMAEKVAIAMEYEALINNL